jgi:preprotein translocase subunit SecA
MDQFRQGIGLRAYGQEDPVRAYQREGFDMFDEMTHSIWEDTVKYLYQVENPDKIQRKRVAEPLATNADEITKTIVNKEKKVGRNDPCPCGSGKKYKKCCGQDE